MGKWLKRGILLALIIGSGAWAVWSYQGKLAEKRKVAALIAEAAEVAGAFEAVQESLTSEKLKNHRLRERVDMLEEAGGTVVEIGSVETGGVGVEIPCPSVQVAPPAAPSRGELPSPPMSPDIEYRVATPSVTVQVGPARWEWAVISDPFGKRYLTIEDPEVFVDPPGRWYTLPIEEASLKVDDFEVTVPPRTLVGLEIGALAAQDGLGWLVGVEYAPAKWAGKWRLAEARAALKGYYGQAPTCSVGSRFISPIESNVSVTACDSGRFFGAGVALRFGVGKR